MRWNSVNALAEALEENYPDEDLSSLTTREILDLIIDLPEFEDDPDEAGDTLLRSILLSWRELRESHI